MRAWRDGVQAGSAILQLHDTRDMRPERVEVTLLPNPANVPVGEDLRVITRTTFFDANDVPLPDDEVFWEVQLPEGVQGVTVEGSRLRVSPLAQAGEVAVTVRERSGVEQVTALTLAPAMDIGLQSQPADLYPPCASSNADFLHISGAQPFDDEVSISVTLNGQGGQFTGMQLQSFGTYWVLLMDKNFIRHYPGAWPIEVRVLAVRNGQIVGAALSRLHDTRTMVCTRVDLQFNPGDQVQIPHEGETLVIAGPRFYDKDGISLPHGELPWSAQMVDPMEGVNMVKHLLYIGPGARPGAYRIAILGPNGLNRAKVLQLY